MGSLRATFKKYAAGPMVRPLGLAAPIFVLLIALPLLRPLRHPSEIDISSDEMLRLSTTRALVEHRHLNLDAHAQVILGTIRNNAGVFSAQPPMMAVLLAGPAWVLTRLGYSFETNLPLISYLLTTIGTTLPVALGAGLLYRMGRLFELPRPWRAALAVATVTGSGLLSYSTVLNADAPAAVLILCTAGCLIHVAAIERADHRVGWFALAGGCAALAATLQPLAVIFLPLLACVILAMPFTAGRRIIGVLVYILGCVPVLALHAACNIPVTGDAIPASMHAMVHNAPPISGSISHASPFDEDDANDGSEQKVVSKFDNAVALLVGAHGPFSHFPILILGVAGIFAVMHRHWPPNTKVLAAISGISAILVLILVGSVAAPPGPQMFALRPALIFSPLLLFWAGAWLRRTHVAAAYVFAALLLAMSMFVGVVGAADPMPERGYDRYSALTALQHTFQRSSTRGTALVKRSM